MNNSEIDDFEVIQGQLQAFHDEMNTLSKKSPNESLNKFKLNLVNAVLSRANIFLTKKRLPFTDFSLFDVATLPSNSDVLVIIAQYLSAFEKVRVDNIEFIFGYWHWKSLSDKGQRRKTYPPKNLK